MIGYGTVMKKLLITAVILLALVSCGYGQENSKTRDSYEESANQSVPKRDYREDMRDFVIAVSKYAKSSDPNFLIIPQNGHELMTIDGSSNGDLHEEYLNAIDGIGREDLNYGYESHDEPTPELEREDMTIFMDLAESENIEVLVTDYCLAESFIDDSYRANERRGYVSFAADSRELNKMPEYPSKPYNENDKDIAGLSDAENFLYLINTENFGSKMDFIESIQETNYDLVIIDLFHHGDEALSSEEVESMKMKSSGGKRLVIAYLSIGEAEDYRYYWRETWSQEAPVWLENENPNWPGNHKVQYWNRDWQEVIYGNDTAYLDRIINAGFDGVYLDIIDAFEYFEQNTTSEIN